MIVVTTSWAPDVALRNPGMKPGAAPKSPPTSSASGIVIQGPALGPMAVATAIDADGAHQELAAPADVEQPGLEAEADAQARQNQRRGVDERRVEPLG